MALINKNNINKFSPVRKNISKLLKIKYDALWNDPYFKKRFCNRKVKLGSKTEEWILERDKCKYSKTSAKSCKPDEIPCIEISDKLSEGSTLLFVGMNPSGADKRYYKGNVNDVLIYPSGSPYYKAMAEFTKACLGNSDDFSELDLFGIVQGTQSVIKKDFLENPDYYKEMFELFWKYVVVKVQPKVIVVANALASSILRRDKSLKLNQTKYDNFYKSTYFSLAQNTLFGGYTLTAGKFTCQLYFSSMLSGQHALDKGSREDLVWLVKNYL